MYCGIKLFASLNKIFALFQKTFCINESVCNDEFAVSKSIYSSPRISILKALFFEVLLFYLHYSLMNYPK